MKETNISDELKTESVVDRDSVQTQNTTTITEETEKEAESEDYWRIYDTSKPENPETKRPPILAEGKTMHRQKDCSNRMTQQEAQQKGVNHHEQLKEEKKEAEVKTDASKKVGVGVDGIEVVVISLVMIFIVALYLRIRKS